MSDPTFKTRCPECRTKIELSLGRTGQLIDCDCGESFRAVRNHKVTRFPIASVCIVVWAIGTVAIGVNTWNERMGAFNQIQDILKDAQNLGDALNQ
jgi:hypothetical protein